MKFTLGLFIVISVVVSQICLAHGENERETFEAEDNDPRDDFNDDQRSDSNDDQGAIPTTIKEAISTTIKGEI